MLAKTLKRACMGFFLGVFVGNIISLLTGWPDSIVSALLMEKVGSLCPAFLIQTLLSGVLGAVSFAGVSLYEIESWSLLRVSVVHYLIIIAAYLIIAFCLYWIVTVKDALIWAAIMAAAYLIIFLIMSAIYRAQVRELNELNEQRKKRRKENRNDGGTL